MGGELCDPEEMKAFFLKKCVKKQLNWAIFTDARMVTQRLFIT